MNDLVEDFIAMNRSGRVLELCEKYYDDNVLMLNNGAIFAKSMKEAYEKQKDFVESIKAFDIGLVSSKLSKNISELVFHYKMTTADSKAIEFTGKHIQTWQNGKIVREEYQSMED